LLNSYIVRKPSESVITQILHNKFYKEKRLLPAYFRVNDLADMLGTNRRNFIRDKNYLIKEGYIRTLDFQYKGKWDRSAYILGEKADIMEHEDLYAWERCVAPETIVNIKITFSNDINRMRKNLDDYIYPNCFQYSDELKEIFEREYPHQNRSYKQDLQNEKDLKMRLILPRNVVRSEQFLDWAGRSSFRVWIYLMMNLIRSNDMESETAKILYNDFYENHGLLVSYFDSKILGMKIGISRSQVNRAVQELLKFEFIKTGTFKYKNKSKRCFILGERGNNFDDKIYVFEKVLVE